ncbi:metal-dependent hydrolase [Actinospica durhamensis]|uniref:Metal-dependent hydrolase n=1 Tax=Actinospica durhamensis TaxID=1508375 RepID=A0A941IV93_9ACTN|nr:metal-dependent hydrolase [Actinospica durhamensis]MBR7836696.1 metal-dependent hydrolase [Actinospica durhamensis]
MVRHATTLVTFPSGATEGASAVLAVVPLPSVAEAGSAAESAGAETAGGTVGLVVDTTPFHPVDHTWPDQPGDSGTVLVDGVAYPVLDCVTGAVGPEGEFALGADIPVRRGEESWSWLVVHVLEAEPALESAVGSQALLRVDAARRRALSAAHTGCHLTALALNEALAGRWNRAPGREDAFGRPDFDSIAMDSSRMDEHASTDRYRIGKSLRKKGFDPQGLAEALPQLAEAVNARLAGWIAADAAVRVELVGGEKSAKLTARRAWVCDLPEGTASIFCGGTHLDRLGELAGLHCSLSLSEDGTELVAVTVPKPR